jgi:hypothetical protein
MHHFHYLQQGNKGSDRNFHRIHVRIFAFPSTKMIVFIPVEHPGSLPSEGKNFHENDQHLTAAL